MNRKGVFGEMDNNYVREHFIEPKSPAERHELFIEILKIAKASENEAIQIAMVAMAFAPPEFVPQLAEILNDENDHDVIYTDMLFEAVTGKFADNAKFFPVDSMPADMKALDDLTVRLTDGGSGSGNHNHDGRPGKVGGSIAKYSEAEAKERHKESNKRNGW